MSADQGSESWLLERVGFCTASNASAVLAKGQGKTRTAYLRRLVCERLTGKPTETYSNSHTERGLAQEPFARLAYEGATGNFITEVGFIPHKSLMAGASSDGLIDLDGEVEIKSTIPTVHLDTVLSGGYPPEHRAQIMFQLWILGRSWCDFVSFCPDMPDNLKLYIFRVVRDEPFIATLAAEVKQFLSEVDALVAKMKEIK